MIEMPGQVARLAQFYHGLANMLEAGIPLLQVVEKFRQGGGWRLGRALRRLHERLLLGDTLTEALAATGRAFPSFDKALLAAGEQSGRLDHVARLLADYHRERYELMRSALQRMGYPALVVFVAVMVFPPGAIVALIRGGDVTAFVMSKLLTLAKLAAVFLVLTWFLQPGRGLWLRSLIEGVARWVPVWGKARYSRALARLALALDALLNAGVSVVQAWEMAGEASGSPRLLRACRKARRAMEEGATPSEAIAATKAFPWDFVSMYASGEQSGRIDQSLAYLRRHHEEESRRGYRTLAVWIPLLLYLVILVVIAWHIVSFWLGYYQNVFQQYGI
ncbi:MAG: hypothetical protein D6766_11475 [Verrucomicrobia bacterium]|nr:MAG: hypothetical protein D6766_11475 [Verrucomicrobiota bacterium]